EDVRGGVPPADQADGAPPVRAAATASGPGVRDNWDPSLKNQIHQELLAALTRGQMEQLSEQELRLELAQLAEALSRQDGESLGLAEQETLVEQVLNEVFGYGPIEGLMRDHEISDILINGPRQLFIEKRGQLQPTEVTFRDEKHLLQVIRRMIAGSGRRIDKK